MQPIVHYIIEKHPSGFIGQCVELPQVITEADTEEGLRKQMKVILDGYFKAFPQAHETLKKSVGFGTYTVKINTSNASAQI